MRLNLHETRLSVYNINIAVKLFYFCFSCKSGILFFDDFFRSSAKFLEIHESDLMLERDFLFDVTISVRSSRNPRHLNDSSNQSTNAKDDNRFLKEKMTGRESGGQSTKL